MNEEQPDIEKAAAVMEQARRGRIAACEQAIQEALRKYRCALDVSVTLRANQVLPQAQIVTQD